MLFFVSREMKPEINFRLLEVTRGDIRWRLDEINLKIEGATHDFRRANLAYHQMQSSVVKELDSQGKTKGKQWIWVCLLATSKGERLMKCRELLESLQQEKRNLQEELSRVTQKIQSIPRLLGQRTTGEIEDGEEMTELFFRKKSSL